MLHIIAQDLRFSNIPPRTVYLQITCATKFHRCITIKAESTISSSPAINLANENRSKRVIKCTPKPLVPTAHRASSKLRQLSGTSSQQHFEAEMKNDITHRLLIIVCAAGLPPRFSLYTRRHHRRRRRRPRRPPTTVCLFSSQSVSLRLPCPSHACLWSTTSPTTCDTASGSQQQSSLGTLPTAATIRPRPGWLTGLEHIDGP